MFSRRRTRGYHDSQLNQGISTPSASASAAANAFYSRSLGPSAAAEALRRHSLDRSDADAIRDFRPAPVSHRANSMTRTSSMTRTNSLSQGPPLSRVNSMRTNSLTRGQNVRHYEVVHHPRATQPQRAAYTPSTPRGQLSSPARRNSLTNSGGRSNSLTRTHTVVNRDSQGRTMSLTTTTVRQMGSFELVTTKDVPIGSPASPRLSRPHAPFAGDSAGVESIHSLDSELVGIQEEPEVEDNDVPMDIHGRDDVASFSSDAPTMSDAVSDVTPSPGNTPPRRSTQPVVAVNPGESTELPSPPQLSRALDGEGLGSNGGSVEDFASAKGSVSSSEERLAPPIAASGAPLHREVSPARSALRRGSVDGQKSRVSFGGADEPYVYESYEYEDEEELPKTQQTPVAAAAAATRARLGSPLNGNARQSYQAAAAAQSPLVVSNPPQNVAKRASEASLTGKGQAQRRASQRSNQSYPRQWESPATAASASYAAAGQTDDFSIPARSTARPSAGPRRAGGGLAASSALQQQEEAERAAHAQIHAQALALAQAQFRDQSDGAPEPAKYAPSQPLSQSHHYRGLVDDDAASVHSDSSFTRERRRGPSAAPGGAHGPGRLRSLRQPATPTLRAGGPPRRRESLLNQAPPNPAQLMQQQSASAAQPQAGPTSGFRTYSLRKTARPDPSTLLSGAAAPEPAAIGGGFRSRIADSDSEDEGGFMSKRGRSKGSSGNGNANGSSNGKLTLSEMFSPNTDVKDVLFKNRSQSETLPSASKPKKPGFFKRVFGKKQVAESP